MKMNNPNLEMRVSRASAVVVQRVPAVKSEWFLQWQNGVSKAAADFSGYRGTDVYPPGEDQQDEWVVVIHFDDEQSLSTWLESSIRDQWVEKLKSRIGDFELKALPGGFGHWFVGLDRSGDSAPPPSWKMAIAVLFGLYPTVMVLTLFPGPYTQPLGLAFSMLIGNALSVVILQWAVMPLVSSALGPWLKADTARQRALSIGGPFVILAVLVGFAILFRQVTG